MKAPSAGLAGCNSSNRVHYQCNDEFLDSLFCSSDGGGVPSCEKEGFFSPHVRNPPRLLNGCLQGTCSTGCVDLREAAASWASRRGLCIVAEGHAVVCKATGAILFVDLVMEKKQKHSQCLLACIYYSPEGRGGRMLQEARDYMRHVQLICNRDMHFFPVVLALCVYEDSMMRTKVYAKDVSSS